MTSPAAWLTRAFQERPGLTAAVGLYLGVSAVQLILVFIGGGPTTYAGGFYPWEVLTEPGQHLESLRPGNRSGVTGAPEPPTDLAIAVSLANQFELSWTDGSDDEEGFKLQRARDGRNWLSIWTNRDAVGYVDRGLPDGLYCYRVRSYNSAGESVYAYATPNCLRTGTPFRWTSHSAHLLEPMTGDAVHIPIYVGRPDVPGATIPLTISIGGIALTETVLDRGGWYDFSYYLPPIVGPDDLAARWQGSVWIDFDVGSTIVPSAVFDSDDGRRLGVGVGAVEWSDALPEVGIGFHAWEEAADGEQFRWTRRRASQPLTTAASTAVFRLRADHPDVDDRPVIAEIFWDGRLLESIPLPSVDWTEVAVAPGVPPGTEGVLTVHVDRVWKPSDATGSSDSRPLGVAMTPVDWRR